MLIICPSCATSYEVETASLQPAGRQVRCVRCRTIWHAESTQANKLVAAAAALAPVPGEDAAPEAAAPAPAAEASSEPAASDSSEPETGNPPDPPAEEDWPATPPTAAELPDAEPHEAPSDEPAALMPSADTLLAEAPPTEMASAAMPSAAPSEAAAVETLPVVEVMAGPLAGDPDTDGESGPIVEQKPELPEDVESVAARRYGSARRRRTWNWPMPRLHAAVLALLIADSVLIGWRSEIVRLLPQTASFYSLLGLGVNLSGLTFEHVVTSTEQHDGAPVLLVEGNIVNASAGTVNVPQLRLEIRNSAKQEIYSWTAKPQRGSLAAGESMAFRSRLASAPADSHDVLVRFVNRRDVVANLN